MCSTFLVLKLYILRYSYQIMRGLLSSFNPLLSRYKVEVFLLGVAFLICSISTVLYFQQNKREDKLSTPTREKSTYALAPKRTITIDVSGAVAHPFVYTFNESARIIDAIQKAGGLTEEADRSFVYRNMNYARILRDQEKIYIPYLSDIANGVVLENKRILDYTQPNINQATIDAVATRVNINSASVIELDQLPGIGKVSAEAIINARPYTTPEELVANLIIKQSVYDKIKDLISVY